MATTERTDPRPHAWDIIDDPHVDPGAVLNVLIGSTTALERLERIIQEKILTLWKDPSAMSQSGFRSDVWASRITYEVIGDLIENERRWLGVIRRARRVARDRTRSKGQENSCRSADKGEPWWVGPD
jgi:hypothetical protein